MVQEVKEKVNSLEKTLENFIRHTNLGFAKVHDALIEQKQAMEDFKNEMGLFRDEMKEFKDETKNHRVQMNKQWGELANRLGTLAEDFVAPNIPYIAQIYFQCPAEAEFFMVRCKKMHSKEKAKRREFDVIAVYRDKVILNETKSTPRQQYLDDFAGLLPDFFDYFPEYSNKELIPIFSSLYVDEQTVEHATKLGIYVLTIKGDTMDLRNYDSVKR